VRHRGESGDEGSSARFYWSRTHRRSPSWSRTYQYPEGSSARFYKCWILSKKTNNRPVSIPRRVERSFLLQDTAYFTPFCKNNNHILPFFHLRASQKNKFRRRCSYFSFSLPPYLAFTNVSTPIYRGVISLVLRASQKRDFTPGMLAKALKIVENLIVVVCFFHGEYAMFKGLIVLSMVGGTTDESDLNLQKNV